MTTTIKGLKGWNYRAWGTASDPVRQSALNDIASQNGCARRYYLMREAQARGEETLRESVHWRTTLGTAVHAVIDRSLSRAWPMLVEAMHPELGRGIRRPEGLVRRVELAFDEEMEKAREGLPIEWHGEDPAAERAEAVAMIVGALRTTVERAEEVIGCEVPFVLDLDGYIFSGTIDLLYRPRGAQYIKHVAIADWKTGQRKLDQIVLDHGYQPAIYRQAVYSGVLWPGTDKAVTLSTWPVSMDIVHLRDFVPYVRAPRTAGKKVGDEKGPGWYQSHRTEASIDRLRVSIRNVVGSVRMGRFIESLGEQCRRCPYRTECLTDGSGPTANDLRHVERALEGIELDEHGLPRVA